MVRQLSLIRYPGGKSKLLGEITGRLRRMSRRLGPDAEYREPFFGAGAVGLALLGYNPPVRSAWVNDCDPAMASLWHSVIHDGESLRVMVEAFPEAVRLLEECDYFRAYTNAERVLPAREEYTRCVYRLKLSHLVGRTIPPGFERKHSLEW